MKKYSSNLAFTDLLFNLLIGFTSLLLIAFLLINPIAEEGIIDPRSEFIITMQWEDTSGLDIDLWIKGPQNVIVGFPQKDGAYIVLERDDLGDANDIILVNETAKVIERNLETISINAIVPGEYFVSVHNYSTAIEDVEEEYPTKVRVDLMDTNPFKLMASREVSVKFKEEVSVFSFVIDENGYVTDVNDRIKLKIRPNSNEDNTSPRPRNQVNFPAEQSRYGGVP